jgi:hypothetical protein
MDTALGRCGRALDGNHRCLTEAVVITAPCRAAEWIAHPTRGTAGQLNEQGSGSAHGHYGPRAVGPETRTAWFGRRNDERDLNEADLTAVFAGFRLKKMNSDQFLSVQRSRSGAGWVGATRAEARGVTTQTDNWIALLGVGVMAIASGLTRGGVRTPQRICRTPGVLGMPAARIRTTPLIWQTSRS